MDGPYLLISPDMQVFLENPLFANGVKTYFPSPWPCLQESPFVSPSLLSHHPLPSLPSLGVKDGEQTVSPGSAPRTGTEAPPQPQVLLGDLGLPMGNCWTVTHQGFCIWSLMSRDLALLDNSSCSFHSLS